MASPTKVISVSIITNVPKADITIQGAVRRELVPCFNSSPKLGVGAVVRTLKIQRGDCSDRSDYSKRNKGNQGRHRVRQNVPEYNSPG